VADEFTVQLTGKEDLIAAFRALRSELPRDPTRKPVKAATDYLTAEIQRAAPLLTGTLMAAIRSKITRSQGATHGKITIASDARYWRFLELGWHAHGTGNWFRFPFITPTTRTHLQTTGQIVIDGCTKEIDKIAQRLGLKD
jgi:HK97 gp10 family phage protein